MLLDGFGSKMEVYDPESNLREDYDTAFTEGQMDNKDSPKSFYVVYDKTKYGISDGTAAQSKFVPPDPLSGGGETVKFGFIAQSAQGFDLRTPGIVLFEHPNYIGNARQYRSSQKDISSSFPAQYWVGVSSFIVTGGKWKLYAAKNFKPPTISVKGQSILGPGCYNYDQSFNDKVQSIERVDEWKELKLKKPNNLFVYAFMQSSF